MTKFQIIILCVFGVFIIAGLVIFASYKGKGEKQGPPVTVWGTVDRSLMNGLIEQVKKKSNQPIEIQYTQFSEAKFDTQFVEALATDKGPDAILVSQDMLYRHYNKLIAIPYDSYPEADFKNTFIQGGQLYLDSNGIVGVPFALNLMVMYWNRDIFTNANIPQPPKTWEEFKVIAPELTVRDAAGNITQSAVGLGEYRNVANARDILSLLMMQAGNPVVLKTKNNIEVTLGSQISSRGIQSANAALTFFTEFANPVKQVYTWNRSLRDSKELFIANKLGVYFGYASDYNDIRQKNPNLNFDVALIPQVTPSPNTTPVKLTYGKIYGASIVRSTRSISNTANALYLLTSREANMYWTETTGLPGVRFDSLSADPGNAASGIFSTSALWARSWFDPNKSQSDVIFQDMIEAVTSGRETNEDAIEHAGEQLEKLFN